MKNKKFLLLPRLNMEILHAEHAELNNNWRATDIASPFTRVYLVTRGSGFVRYGNTEITLSPGNIYIIPAGLKNSFGCEDHLNKTYFHIAITLPTGYDLLEGLNECLVFNDERTVEEITECVKIPSAKSLIRIQSFLYDIVYRSINNIDDFSLKKLSAGVSETISFIDANISATLTLAKISDALSSSPAKLRKDFREETGISIGKYVDNRVMHKAELMVREGIYSIKEISDMLGFCDQFYFSRCFAQKFGMPPSRYREHNTYNKL